MSMWDHITPPHLLAARREMILNHMGQEARQLLADGYSRGADRVLDELNDLRKGWGSDG